LSTDRRGIFLTVPPGSFPAVHPLLPHSAYLGHLDTCRHGHSVGAGALPRIARCRFSAPGRMAHYRRLAQYDALCLWPHVPCPWLHSAMVPLGTLRCPRTELMPSCACPPVCVAVGLLPRGALSRLARVPLVYFGWLLSAWHLPQPTFLRSSWPLELAAFGTGGRSATWAYLVDVHGPAFATRVSFFSLISQACPVPPPTSYSPRRSDDSAYLVVLSLHLRCAPSVGSPGIWKVAALCGGTFAFCFISRLTDPVTRLSRSSLRTATGSRRSPRPRHPGVNLAAASWWTFEPRPLSAPSPLVPSAPPFHLVQHSGDAPSPAAH